MMVNGLGHYCAQRLNFDLIKSNLEKETWDSVFIEIIIENAVKNLYNKTIGIIETFTKEIKITSKNKKIKDWMTACLLRSTRKKKMNSQRK